MRVENIIKRIRTNLQVKATVATICMFSVVILLIAFVSYYFMNKLSLLTYEKLQKRGESLAKNLSQNAQYGIMIESADTLAALLKPLETEADISYILIQNAQGLVLSQYTREDKKTTIEQLITSVEGKVPETGSKILKYHGRDFVYDIVVQVESDSSTNSDERNASGTVRLGISLIETAQIVSESMIFIAISMLVILVASSVGVYYFTRNLLGPVKNLTLVAQKIAAGNIRQDAIPVTTEDEIGQLSQAFNNVCQSLNDIVQRADMISQGKLGAAEAERKLSGGTNLEDAVKSDNQIAGDLGQAFERMQVQLRKLTLQAKMIANDNLDNAILNTIIPGELGEAFAQMTAKLKEFALFAGQMANGDFSMNIESHSSKEVLTNSFARMVSQLRKLIEEVKSQTVFIGNSSNTLAQVSMQSATTVAQLASTSTQISASASSIAQSSQSASNTARETDNASRKGKELMIAFVEKIRNIKAITEVSSKAMDVLSKRSAEIGEIVGLITKIADQTNLLSLNAAIEAARAGEAGRGFAVVADEVRKLAESSAQSAQKISKIIGVVQSETQDAASSVKNGQAEISEGAAITEEASDKFSEIVNHVGNIAHQIEMIAAAAEETAASAEESSSSSEEQSTSMENISTSASQLADIVKRLQSALVKFKV